MAAHERPAAVELFAVERELELALLVVARGVLDAARLRRPRPAIPHDDAARAVIALGDIAFERAVIDRMILDMHREPLHRWIEARALGHGPRFERAVEFEPEVVVQA